MVQVFSVTRAPGEVIPRHSGVNLLVLLVAVSTGAGCGGEDAALGPADEPVATPSFVRDVGPILASSTCASTLCHSTAKRAGGLGLEEVAPVDLVDRTANDGIVLVVPFDAQDSYLIRKLEGRSILGRQMPLEARPLSTGKIGTIRNWIDQGALDN